MAHFSVVETTWQMISSHYFLGFHTQSLMEFPSRWQCYLLSVCLALSSASSSGFQGVSICYWDPNSTHQAWMVKVWLLQLPQPQTFSCNTYLARYLWIKTGQMPVFFLISCKMPNSKCHMLFEILCCKWPPFSELKATEIKGNRFRFIAHSQIYLCCSGNYL